MTNNTLYLIIYADIFFWLLPPFRQYSTKYFYYFLVMGLTDPIGILIFKLFHLNAGYFYIFSNILLVYSIFFEKKNVINFLFTIIIGSVTYATLVIFKSSFTVNNIIIIITHIIIFSKVLKDFIVEIFNSSKVNIFYLFFILYMLSLIIKLLFYITEVKTGYLYFYLTGMFELLMAVYFTFFNVKNSKIIQLKSI